LYTRRVCDALWLVEEGGEFWCLQEAVWCMQGKQRRGSQCLRSLQVVEEGSDLVCDLQS